MVIQGIVLYLDKEYFRDKIFLHSSLHMGLIITKARNEQCRVLFIIKGLIYRTIYPMQLNRGSEKR